MTLVETKWIAFLDDDDIISNDYIDTFYKELYIAENDNINLDVIIFRMKYENTIIPKLKTDNFYLCDVGISFILKKKIYENGLKFIPDGAEDYLYLNNIRTNGYKIMISPHIKYFVRQNIYTDEKIIGNRVFININNYFKDLFVKKDIYTNNNKFLLLFNCYIYLYSKYNYK